MIDNHWLTETYLKSLGYYKVSDDGQYGVYLNEHWVVMSLTYGHLPKDYRRLTFNRDSIGVFLSVESDWNTRFSIKNAIVNNPTNFEILLDAAC